MENDERERIDSWLTEHCGKGTPMFKEATTRDEALHGLAYILRQIEGTNSYRVNIGQTNEARSAIRWMLDHIAKEALANDQH